MSVSLQSTLCHFTSPPILSASLHDTFRYFHLTSRHFTSPILSASIHATLLRLLFFMHHFTSLCATLLRLPSLSLPHFTPLRVASHFFSLASPHFTPLHFTSRFVHLTSLHFMPLRFDSFYLPRFTPLHATSLFFHLTLRHITSPPILSASLHATSCHLPFFLPHLMPLHSTSLHLPSFRLTSPHLISSIRLLRFGGNASPKKYVNAQCSKHASQPASPSKDSHWRIFGIFVTFAKDSDIQKIQIFPKSFEYFVYPPNFTIFAKDSDIRKIQLW